MSRKAVSPDTQTSVLLKSRRRCCICFSLTRDTGLKVGQIAHVDRDNKNSAEDNLVFLCFDHHDEYDSRTSQRKGFTAGEIKSFRNELHSAIGKAFSLPVHFGNVTFSPEDPFAGQYIRLDDDTASSAEITLTPLGDALDSYPRYAVTGFALFGKNREFGPNFGELSFIGTLLDNVIEFYSPDEIDSECHSIHLLFNDRSLTVKESNFFGIYGFGVTFIGEHERRP